VELLLVKDSRIHARQATIGTVASELKGETAVLKTAGAIMAAVVERGMHATA
jgi:hypothetical protein